MEPNHQPDLSASGAYSAGGLVIREWGISSPRKRALLRGSHSPLHDLLFIAVGSLNQGEHCRNHPSA